MTTPRPHPGREPAAGPRPELRARPLVALIAGHLVVAAGVVVLTGLLLLDGLGDAVGDDRPPGARLTAALGGTLLGVALAALVVAQVLSVRRLRAETRAVAAGRLDDGVLADGVRRIGWPVVLAYYPIILGLLHLVTSPPPPSLLALLSALVAASLLLDHAHAARTYRMLAGRTANARRLPAGAGQPIRDGQRTTAALYAVVAAAGAILLAATIATEAGQAATAPATATVQVAAALGVTLLPLLLLRPVLQVRAAVDGDTVRLGTLDAAAATFARAGLLAAPVAALASAAVVAAPAVPLLAAARALPLLLLLGSATLQLASATSINLGDIPLGTRTRRATAP